MSRLKIGDRIDCRIKSQLIVSPYADYDEVRTFEVIGITSRGYYLYVPPNVYLKDAIRIDEYNFDDLGVHPRFIEDETIFVPDKMIYKVSARLDGCHCDQCDEFYSYAEPNQPNGTLICFSCRNYPFYQSEPDEDY